MDELRTINQNREPPFWPPIGGGRETRGGVPLTQAKMESYLDSLVQKGRVPGTIDGYRRKLQQLYRFLPKGDKTIRRGTLRLWRESLLQKGYSAAAINQSLVVANSYLAYLGARELQMTDMLEVSREDSAELTRKEYLKLLSTARALGRERVYLLIKVFGNSDLPLQELEQLTVEAAREGKLQLSYKCSVEIIRFPASICRELLDYAQRKGIRSGPVFRTRDGTPMGRTNVTIGIRQLCAVAGIPEEKGSPRCLRKLYRTTREGMERSIALLVEQAQDRLLEDEQLQIGWDNCGPL